MPPIRNYPERQKLFVYQAVNIFIPAVKLDILIWSSTMIDFWRPPSGAVGETAVLFAALAAGLIA